MTDQIRSLMAEWHAQAERWIGTTAGPIYLRVAEQLAAISDHDTEPKVVLHDLSDSALAARVTALWDRQLAAQQLERDLDAAVIATELEQEKRTR